eukprot:939445_1
MCGGNRDDEVHEDVDFVDLEQMEAQTGNQAAPPVPDGFGPMLWSKMMSVMPSSGIVRISGCLLFLAFLLLVVYSNHGTSTTSKELNHAFVLSRTKGNDTGAQISEIVGQTKNYSQGIVGVNASDLESAVASNASVIIKDANDSTISNQQQLTSALSSTNDVETATSNPSTANVAFTDNDETKELSAFLVEYKKNGRGGTLSGQYSDSFLKELKS